jgi:hypothetical protein
MAMAAQIVRLLSHSVKRRHLAALWCLHRDQNPMKPVLVFIAMISCATEALAQSGATTLTMTCATARGIVASQGAVVLRTGPTTYDRYVRDSSFCALHETARPAWVRTVDTAQCPVGGVCRSIEIDNGQ